MKRRADQIIRNIGQLLTLDGPPVPRRGEDLAYLGIMEKAAVAIEGDRVAAAGPESEIMSAFEAPADCTHDAAGGVVLPGFVDPHTHLLFAGSRETEFEMRCRGKTYMEIAAAGGGIRSTVRTFREAEDERILRESARRLDRMLSFGTTTAEAKSGYGLSTEQELRALRLTERLNRMHEVDLVPTFMGAHEFPDEFRENRGAYVDLVISEMIPRAAKETDARFCDVFCEAGVFTVEQSRRILTAARDHGMGLKLHAEEFEPIGGAHLAAELGATSADHLLVVTDEGLEAMAEAGVTAVLLPITSYSLGKHIYARGRAMVEKMVPIALATDCNPGSSMSESMPLAISIACLEVGLTPAEAVSAATVNAAHAVGLSADRGRIASGMRADLQILDAPSYVSLAYHLGPSHVDRVFKSGRCVA